jgi:tight adherence protein C
MTAAVTLGALVGLGCIGVAHGVFTSRPSLASIVDTMARTTKTTVGVTGEGGATGLSGAHGVPLRAGRAVIDWIDGTTFGSHPALLFLNPCLSITGELHEGLAFKVLAAGGAGLLGPLLFWVAAQLVGIPLSPVPTILVAAIAAPGAAFLPVAMLIGRARDRRRHFRIVIGSFVDLVVLSLAGGVGVEGALLAASRVSDDWAATRMARALSKARDAGQSPWAGLGQLGTEIGVSELVELSTTLQLAGTEGARIRQSLTARAVSLRRHEQADAESAANTVTERLFLPGALLLFGFLLFIGYPAFSRILGGI